MSASRDGAEGRDDGPPSRDDTRSGRYRPISRDVLSDAWGTLARHRFEYRRADGRWDRRTREVYDRGDGAVALLHDPDGDTVLLTRQFRLPMQVGGRDPFVIEAPAGQLDGAEPVERMRAELMEETGYAAGRLTRVADLAMSPGAVTEVLTCFVGTYRRDERTGPGGGAAGEGEDIEVLHVPLPRALAMIGTGEIRDAKTAFLLQHLAARMQDR